MTESVKEITKLENTSPSDFKLHTEERKHSVLHALFCAADGGMMGSVEERKGK